MAQDGTVMGSDFKWWMGVVEDRGTGQFSGVKDELKLGRIKVRIKGKHTDDKGVLPTKELPWCYVLQSTSSAAISGVGKSPSGLVEQSKVIGFFMDGDAGQIPIVFGVMPHIAQKEEAGPNAPGSGAKK
jgi:Gp5 N-terminal OB domain